MKRSIFLAIILLLGGCAPFKDAPYLEQEFGKDSRAAWDAQVIHKDGRYGERIPEEMTGIIAEEVMSVRNQGYAEKTTKKQSFDFGLGGSK